MSAQCVETSLWSELNSQQWSFISRFSFACRSLQCARKFSIASGCAQIRLPSMTTKAEEDSCKATQSINIERAPCWVGQSFWGANFKWELKAEWERERDDDDDARDDCDNDYDDHHSPSWLNMLRLFYRQCFGLIFCLLLLFFEHCWNQAS